MCLLLFIIGENRAGAVNDKFKHSQIVNRRAGNNRNAIAIQIADDNRRLQSPLANWHHPCNDRDHKDSGSLPGSSRSPHH